MRACRGPEANVRPYIYPARACEIDQLSLKRRSTQKGEEVIFEIGPRVQWGASVCNEADRTKNESNFKKHRAK